MIENPHRMGGRTEPRRSDFALQTEYRKESILRCVPGMRGFGPGNAGVGRESYLMAGITRGVTVKATEGIGGQWKQRKGLFMGEGNHGWRGYRGCFLL